MTRRKSDLLEKTASPEEAAKGAEEWQQLEAAERLAMLKLIRARKQQPELSR